MALFTAGTIAFNQLAGQISLGQVPDGCFTANAEGRGKFEVGFVNTGLIGDDQVTLAKMEHGTHGDILFYGVGGAPTRLPAGSPGHFLQTQGANADPTWAIAGGWYRIYNTTVATDTQYVDITGLDINTDRCYLMLLNVKNADPLNPSKYYLYVEGDYTDTNYTFQHLYSVGATIGTEVGDGPYVIAAGPSEEAVTTIHIFLSHDGYYYANSVGNGLVSGSLYTRHIALRKNTIVANITSMRLYATSVAGVGTGTKIDLFKVVT